MTESPYKLFTVIIYSENSVGLLNQVSNIFTRRCLNIEDVTASLSSAPGVHKLTITTESAVSYTHLTLPTLLRV